MSDMNLPEHWKAEKLGQLCRVFSGYGFKTKDYTKEGIPLIKIGNLQDGEVVINPDNDYMPESWKENERLRKFILKSRDILIALTGVTGKTAIVPPSLAGTFLNQRVGKIEMISPDAEQDFILVVTKTRLFQEAIQQHTFRSVQGNISPSSIAQIPIPLPPLPEQRAIAHVLGAIQEAKAARQRELTLERERKAALMDHLFSYGTKGEPRKQTDIGEIPESWEVVRLEKIVTLQRGKDLPVQSRHAEDIPIVGSNGIVGWHNEPVENVPIPGVATGRSGSIGLLTYIDQPYWPLNTALYVRDFHGNNPLFVYYWLHLFPFEKYSQGVSVPTLNRNLVHPVPFRLPSLPEQAEIAEILQAFDTKIAALEQETERLDELFHAMLDELMTGQRSAVPLIDAELPN